MIPSFWSNMEMEELMTQKVLHRGPGNEVVRAVWMPGLSVQQGRTGYLKPQGRKKIPSVSGTGNPGLGARTASSNPLWKYINVRRLFLFH